MTIRYHSFIPDLKRGLVVSIRKGKRDPQDCNNYRRVTQLSVSDKAIAHLLLLRICCHLLKLQRPELSEFTLGKSTIDRIVAFRVLVERQLEFWQCMLAADVSFKKVFDSVLYETHCELLRLNGIPARIMCLIYFLHSGTESAVKCGGGMSSCFPVNNGVRQECASAPSVVNTCMD